MLDLPVSLLIFCCFLPICLNFTYLKLIQRSFDIFDIIYDFSWVIIICVFCAPQGLLRATCCLIFLPDLAGDYKNWKNFLFDFTVASQIFFRKIFFRYNSRIISIKTYEKKAIKIWSKIKSRKSYRRKEKKFALSAKFRPQNRSFIKFIQSSLPPAQIYFRVII